MATVRLQLRRGIADDWFDANPVLAAGEIGIETDTNTFKFGDGTTAWNSLEYALSGTVDDYIALSTKGVANGVASLDGSGLIPLAQLPGAAALDAEVSTAVTNHNNATTSVHGIADTSALATKSYADSAVSTHEADTTSVHGIANTANLVTVDANQTLTAKTLASPALTGTPTAPTASVGTDTTQVATTAFVQDAIEVVVGAAPAALNTLAEIATSLADNADLSGTLTTAISGKVAKSGDTMSGVLNMDTNKITALGTATTDYDATNKFYVDQRTANAVGTHKDTTTNIHGISDTANLVYTGDYRLQDARNPIDLSVTEGKITDLAVTTAKIANSAVVTSKLGDTSVTTIKIADDAVTSDKIADNAISQIHISDASVGTNEIDSLAVTTAKIADSAVTTAKIEDLNITEAKINAAAVTADKIGSLAVTEGKIADGAVSTVKIADSAITTGKIANGTIIDADINASAAIAQSKIDGLGTALDAKLASATAATTYAPIESPTFTGTVAGVTKAHVGLGNVDNTSDANKPVSTATQTALDLKANKAAPTFTGTVTASNDLVVDGNLTVNGTTFNASSTSITIEDNMVQLAHQNSGNIVDLGIVVGYNDGAAKHAGLVRDVSDAKWKLFQGVTTEPSTTVNFAQGSLDALAVGALEATTVTPSSGVVFSDGTQTKQGVPSLTVIGTAISGAYNLSTGGLALRDQLIPVAGAHAITVPTNATTAYPVGTSISFYQSAGTDGNFVEASGVTILRTPGLKLRALHSSATITKVATDTWLLAGDLKA